MMGNPRMIRLTIPELVVVVLVSLVLGAGFGHGFTEKQPAEAPAAAVIQEDGSQILERNPPKAYPALPIIPKDAVVTRITSVNVEPIRAIEKMRIDLVQIQTAEGSRVIASTPDGRILGGGDWTGPAIPPPRVYRWQVQALKTWNTEGQSTWGASVGYTRGPLVGSVAMLPGCVQVGIGIRW